MAYFQQVVINFGEVKTGQQVSVDFLKTPNAPLVKSTQGTCSCTQPVDKGDRVTSVYTGEALGPNIKSTEISKRVVVTFADGTVENLLIKGNLVRA